MQAMPIDGFTQWPETISDEKRNFILQLILSNTSNEERDQWLDYLESASTSDDADEIMASLSHAHA